MAPTTADHKQTEIMAALTITINILFMPAAVGPVLLDISITLTI